MSARRTQDGRGLIIVAWCEQISGTWRPKFFVSIATRLILTPHHFNFIHH